MVTPVSGQTVSGSSHMCSARERHGDCSVNSLTGLHIQCSFPRQSRRPSQQQQQIVQRARGTKFCSQMLGLYSQLCGDQPCTARVCGMQDEGCTATRFFAPSPVQEGGLLHRALEGQLSMQGIVCLPGFAFVPTCVNHCPVSSVTFAHKRPLSIKHRAMALVLVHAASEPQHTTSQPHAMLKTLGRHLVVLHHVAADEQWQRRLLRRLRRRRLLQPQQQHQRAAAQLHDAPNLPLRQLQQRLQMKVQHIKNVGLSGLE